MRLEDKIKTIELRKQGFSYKEIIEKIPKLSKSTISGWVKYIDLTPKQQNLLMKRAKSKMDKGRIKAGIIHRENRIKRTNRIIEEAKKEISILIKNPLFIIGLMLYWAEGSTKNSFFQFTNSDPEMLKLMKKWLITYCKIPKEKIKIRIYIHKIYAHENCEKFWSKQLNIPASEFEKTIYKPTPHKIKRNPEYKGCVQIRVFNIELLRRVIAWKNETIKYFN